MARHKDFGSGASTKGLEPITFTLDEETFTCLPAVQGLVILRFVADADSDDGGRAASAIYEFFKSAMPAEEYKRFEAQITSPDRIYDLEKLTEIAGWLTEQYTARPTRPSESSEAGR